MVSPDHILTTDHRTSTLHGIDHAPKVMNISIKRGGILSLARDVVNILVCTTNVVGAVRNRAQQFKALCAAPSYSGSDAGWY
jgi:hypothetical protein